MNNNVGVEVTQHMNNKLTRVDIGVNLTLYYSYETLIAVHAGLEMYKCKNVWSSTTGKHLNKIRGEVLERDEFLKVQERIFGKIDTASQNIARSEEKRSKK